MSEVEVPFQVYEDHCKRCSDCKEMLTPYDDYMDQWSKLDRIKIKIICKLQKKCRWLI